MNINGSDYTLAKVGKELTQQSDSEIEKQERLLTIAQSLLGEFGHQWNAHALVAQKRQTLSRILYYNQLYQKILEVPGVICEFGVQWGATLTQMINLRGMYEPYNVSRKIIGFDTFSGFPNVNEKDGGFSRIGDYSTTENYEQLLDEILTIHESLSPLSHIRKFELVKGDASLTIEDWLVRNPHAIISMAIFDMDVYKPTKTVLEKIIPRLVKGSVLVFDELNCQHFPGETLAVQEVLGLNNLALRRHPHQTYCSWAVFGE
ncbi:Macrocin-O-methyltransferase (TylF) [Aeromonas sp. RU39B]|jgi:hypothetical protein|uniref:TylF/MycF/NovP-related O-methyltransferase n=1 Tax=Aeromonas sp. RU39B TaxID=1907416 RepID=UPI00095737A3|nr:TylF/MycF/NovP-related O-methyltransferase [Aeromonas sp. RU39B]SIR15922.1 Macrocin-O-methyltransferase (TylF) [Aeromonas sp. RU39B]